MKDQEVKKRSIELQPSEQPTEQRSTDVLIVGGGIAAITASLELAELGHNVHLVERQPSIGGHMSRLTKVFPTLDDAQSIISPRMDEVAQTKKVNLHTCAEIMDVQGQPGNYIVKVFVNVNPK